MTPLYTVHCTCIAIRIQFEKPIKLIIIIHSYGRILTLLIFLTTNSITFDDSSNTSNMNYASNEYLIISLMVIAKYQYSIFNCSTQLKIVTFSNAI